MDGGTVPSPPDGAFTVLKTMIEIFEVFLYVLLYVADSVCDIILPVVMVAFTILKAIWKAMSIVLAGIGIFIRNSYNNFSLTRMVAEAFCAHVNLFAAAGISTLTKDPEMFPFTPSAIAANPSAANMYSTRTLRDRLTLHHIAGSTAAAFATLFQSYAMRVVPGSHVNSVYTFTALLFPGHFRESDNDFVRWQAPCIFIGQVLGYFSAAGMLRLILYPDTEIGLTVPVIEDPNDPLIPVLQAIAAEIITTSWQVFTRISLYKDDDMAAHRGFIQRGVTFLGSLFGGFFSGGSMNTIRSIATAVVSNRYDYLYVYAVGPPLGGVLGALQYSMFEALKRRDARRAERLAEQAVGNIVPVAEQALENIVPE